MNLWRYLLTGSDELMLPKDWLANTARLAQYEAYTKRQWHQGSIVTSVEEMRRRAFWKAVAHKQAQQQRPALRIAR